MVGGAIKVYAGGFKALEMVGIGGSKALTSVLGKGLGLAGGLLQIGCAIHGLIKGKNNEKHALKIIN